MIIIILVCSVFISIGIFLAIFPRKFIEWNEKWVRRMDDSMDKVSSNLNFPIRASRLIPQTKREDAIRIGIVFTRTAGIIFSLVVAVFLILVVLDSLT